MTEKKYEKLLAHIDSLPCGQEFRIPEIAKSVGLPRISVNIIILPLVKLGLINCRKVNGKVKFYSKSVTWMLHDAMRANAKRLEQKWLKQKEIRRLRKV